MSSTNKTTYYELPQYTENDIFNPLVDANDAYSKIDTALHNIADAEADDASEIVGIKSRLDSAEGDIDALEAQNGNSVLTTTAQTLSGAVNELDADVSALDGRLDIVEDDINNVSTGLKAKVADLGTRMTSAEGDIDALETQNGNSVLTTTAQTLSGAVNELNEREKFVTPEMYGAIGDGVTDDTNALITAFTHKYIRLSKKTYKVTDSVDVLSSVIDGNGALIQFAGDTWKYHVLDFRASDFIEIDNVKVDAGDNAGQCFRVLGDSDVALPLDHVKITNCYASNTNNKSSQLNSSGIHIEKEAYTTVVEGCNISEIKRESSNSGSSAGTGIAISSAIGTVDIKNNIINGVYLATDDSKIDADGISLFARDFPNTEVEKTSFTISNNLIMNCQGRFFKIKSENCKIVQNTCRNENIEIIDYFRAIDLQIGGGEVANNIVRLINCTSAGTHASFVRVGDYEYTKTLINASIHDNSFYNDVASIAYNGIGIYIPNTIPSIVNIANNQFQNVPRVVYLTADASHITDGYAYVFIDGNSILGTYTSVLSRGATPTAHSTVYKNNNYGVNETNILNKDIEVASEITQGRGIIDNIASQITDLGVTMGSAKWLTHGTGFYIVFRNSSTAYKVIWMYNNVYFYSSVLNEYYTMDATAI